MLGSFSRLQVKNTSSSRTICINFERDQLNYTITFIGSNQGTFWEKNCLKYEGITFLRAFQ